MPAEHERPWQPLSVAEVARLFRPAQFPWWIAGGYAVDHFLGYNLRPHADIDVLLLRQDYQRARALLADWECWSADTTGTFRPWRVGEILPAHAHDIWCRKTPDSPWQLQLMLDESDGTLWQSRRCPDISRPINAIGARDTDGVPFLAIEIQLYYKAKAPRPKDEVDFAAALPLLSRQQLMWLGNALQTAYGPENGWLSQVAARLR